MRTRAYFIPSLLFFLTFFTYIHNLSRSVYGGDVGDLVTAAFVGGVAHPPGYPLFTFLGFLLTRVHFFPSPAFAVGLISVFSGALGVLFFYLTVKLLIKNTFVSFIASCILAFSYFFWFYSEIAEVFALNNLFLIILIYLAIKIFLKKSVKLFPLFFFVLGLSVTNHQTIVLTFPSLMVILLPSAWNLLRKKKINFSVLILSILSFILGFSVYAYVFIVSMHSPLLNWDNVHDISSFLRLILRKDYGTFSAGIFVPPSFLQRLVLVKIYLLQVLLQLTIPVITICLIGVLAMLRQNKRLCISLLLGFLLSGPIFMGYAGFPLTGNFYFGVNERFFILSTLFLLYFFPFGLLFLSNLFEKYLQRNALLLQIVFLIIPFMLFFYNFPKTDLSSVYIGDNYGKDFLQVLPRNGLFFVAGDTTIFNTWYVHYVLGTRPDVQVLNINGNIGSPYYKVLEAKFRKTHPNATAQQVQKSIIDTLPKDGSIFSIEELQPSEGKFTWIPYGLTLQFVSAYPSEAAYTQQQDKVWNEMHIPYVLSTRSLALGNVTISDIPNSYANAMLIVGNYYLSQYKDFVKAKQWYDKAEKVSPGYEKTYSSIGVYNLTLLHNCAMAESNFQKAIAINPIDGVNYLLLYKTYSECFHDTKKAERVVKLFEEQFQTPFKKVFAKYLP